MLAGIDAVADAVGQDGQGVGLGHGAQLVGALTARGPHPQGPVPIDPGDDPDEVQLAVATATQPLFLPWPPEPAGPGRDVPS